jgi:hypothetical protein
LATIGDSARNLKVFLRRLWGSGTTRTQKVTIYETKNGVMSYRARLYEILSPTSAARSIKVRE